jgi:hypothetical protein
MRAAGNEIAECYRVLSKANANLIGEILRGEGPFEELKQYPTGRAIDNNSHSEYFYHSHRAEEHGHFHLFLVQPGMPRGVRPVATAASVPWPQGDEAFAHLVAIRMDSRGLPTALFTTNRWVTGEAWYYAPSLCRALSSFEIDHSSPSWVLNRWCTAMVRLFRPQLEQLLYRRDAAIAALQKKRPEEDIFEARDAEVLSLIKISIDRQRAAVLRALESSLV